MKSILFSLALVLLMAAAANSIACTQNFCSLVRCSAVTEANCAGKIVKNGSTCGCCDACKTVLKPGAVCIDLLLAGGPAPTVVCPDGYICSFETQRCESDTA